MQIKNIIKTLAFVALPLGGVGGGLSSCSNISEDDRLIYVEPAKASRNVLIEDFTGQRCVNCPDAATAIHEIQEVYGENVVAVAIHCGPRFGGISNRNPGLMTDTGKEYWSHWFESTQGQPVAKINRAVTTDTPSNWSSEVAKCLQQTTDVSLSATVSYNKESGNGKISVVTTANVGRKANIQVWLTEDAIIAPQTMPDGSRNNEYVHNHVFRAAVNGAWGDEITYGESELERKWDFSIDLNSDEPWKPGNMHAVVFVYDESGVEQVVEVPFVTSNTAK